MGIRINTRLGKNTSASFPASWLLIGGLLALGAVCAVAQAAFKHPWAAALTWGGLAVLAFATYKACMWLYNKVGQ